MSEYGGVKMSARSVEQMKAFDLVIEFLSFHGQNFSGRWLSEEFKELTLELDKVRKDFLKLKKQGYLKGA
jgi:hypothetical protein